MSRSPERVQTFTAKIPTSLNIAFDKALIREREKTGRRVTRSEFLIGILRERFSSQATVKRQKAS